MSLLPRLVSTTVQRTTHTDANCPVRPGPAVAPAPDPSVGGAELGAERAGRSEADSMDMGPAYAKSVRAEGHAPAATIYYDPFHAVKIVTRSVS